MQTKKPLKIHIDSIISGWSKSLHFSKIVAGFQIANQKRFTYYSSSSIQIFVFFRVNATFFMWRRKVFYESRFQIYNVIVVFYKKFFNSFNKKVDFCKIFILSRKILVFASAAQMMIIFKLIFYSFCAWWYILALSVIQSSSSKQKKQNKDDPYICFINEFIKKNSQVM